MLDPITVLIVKILASACVRFYMSSLLAGGPISYDAQELGYKIPRWYMNPGKPAKVFYSYGTSADGDEFESLEKARRLATDQMAEHIRLSNRAIIEKEVHYDTSSIKQRRLIELFVRGDGLEHFIRMNAKLDKKKLVAVSTPYPDMRAFVRLELKAETYVAYQEKWLNELKTRLMQQKSDDILSEMNAELAAWEKESTSLPTDTIPGFNPTEMIPAAPVPPAIPGGRYDAPAPDAEPAPQQHMPTTAADGPWDDMEHELDEIRK